MAMFLDGVELVEVINQNVTMLGRIGLRQKTSMGSSAKGAQISKTGVLLSFADLSVSRWR